LTRSEEELALRRVGDRWDRTAETRALDPLQGWLDSPIVLETHFQPTISGFSKTNWLVGLAERLRIPRNGRWLSLGCGTAGPEINAAKAHLFSTLVALDGSPKSVEEGRRQAAAAGVENIEFGTANLERLNLPRSVFDVVLMNMSLHHVKRLGRVLSRVNRALRPAGLFLINEFIGPRQFQFTDLQLRLVREFLGDLPQSLRTQRGGEVKTEYVRLPAEHWNRADPSEAIRSDRIVPEVSKRFRILERIDYGGTILNLLLENIVHNFDPSDEKDVAIVRLIARFEDVLMRAGIIPSDFTVMVARKRYLPFRVFRQPTIPWIRRSVTRIARPRVLASGRAGDVIDFGRSPCSEALISGFHQWEGTSRWMGSRSELILRMTSDRLRIVLSASHCPSDRPIILGVRLIDELNRRSVRLEPIHLDGGSPPSNITLRIPDWFVTLAHGRSVRAVLKANRTWIPAKQKTENPDFRELSVQVIRIGFENEG